MNTSTKWWSILLLIVVTLSTANATERKQRILVLHSYHQGLEWTDHITQGIQSVLTPYQGKYEVVYEYLDSKRHRGSDYLVRISALVSAKNRNTRYALIIVSDNNALQALNSGMVKFKGDPPVVFVGINNYSPDMHNHLKHVTGVAETTDHQGTLDIIQHFHPQRRHVLVVLDRTPTGNAIYNEFKSVIDNYQGQLTFRFLRDFDLENLADELGSLGRQDVIYMLTFNRDKNGNFVSYTEGIEMLSSLSSVPIYGSWDFYLGKGIVGGQITSGILQGERAAELALQILSGHAAETIPVVRHSPTQMMFDYLYLQHFELSMSDLPTDSMIIHAPVPYYERYKYWIIIVALCLAVVSVFLIWKNIKQRALLLLNQQYAAELEAQVSQRTEALEKANNELRELTNLDSLTQLYNRRFFDQYVEQVVNAAQSSRRPLSLIMCDIDWFKPFNDSYGHPAGDDCIRLLANSMKHYCDEVAGVPARYGGEEFCIVLPNMSASFAVELAEKIRIDIREHGIPHSESPLGIVTVSFGTATMSDGEEITAAELIAMADKALYESKNQGRDQVQAYREEMSMHRQTM